VICVTTLESILPTTTGLLPHLVLLKTCHLYSLGDVPLESAT